MIETITCWHCGAKKNVVIDHPPSFAAEIALIASDNGWVGVIDVDRERVLIFCCKEHAEKEKTKDGRYRLRAKGEKQ